MVENYIKILPSKPSYWSREEKAKRDAENALYETVKVDIPKNRWHKCPTCQGTKSYLESGDLHRSEGWVPCYHCNQDGLRTYEWVRRLKETT